MSVLRDATQTPVAPNVAYPATSTDNQTGDTAESSAVNPALAGVSDATRDAIKARTDVETDDAKQRKFQSDFNKKLDEAPGFGTKETPDAKKMKRAFAEAGLGQPSGQTANTVYKAVGQDPNYQAMVGTLSKAMGGQEPVPTAAQWSSMLSKTMASAGLSATGAQAAATGSLATTVGANAQAAEAEAPASAGTTDATLAAVTTGVTTATGAVSTATGTTPAAGSKTSSTNGNNYTALVFLAMLDAQEETKKEKNDTLRKIKMYNGMLDKVNQLVNQTLIPAQKKYADLTKEAGDKKSSQVRVAVEFPTDIDTDNALMDQDGNIELAAQWGSGTTPARANLDNNGLAALSKTADGWRQSIQNNQQTESNRYQSQDNNMSSTFNIINALLKNSHEGVSAIVRNV